MKIIKFKVRMEQNRKLKLLKHASITCSLLLPPKLENVCAKKNFKNFVPTKSIFLLSNTVVENSLLWKASNENFVLQ